MKKCEQRLLRFHEAKKGASERRPDLTVKLYDLIKDYASDVDSSVDST